MTDATSTETTTAAEGEVPDGPLAPRSNITTTTRDSGELGRRIGTWLASKLPAGAEPEVCEVLKP